MDATTALGGTELHRRAALLLQQAERDPGRVRADGAELLRAAVAASDPAARSVVERALGLSDRELHDLRGAQQHLSRAVRCAERGGLGTLAAQARLNLAGVFILRGEPTLALRELDRAAPALTGRDRARLEFQRATVRYSQGELGEALAGYRRALVGLRRAGDTLFLAKLHNNRGLLHLYRGELGVAEADLVEAERIYTGLAMPAAAADIHQNLGLLAARRGDLPTALSWLDRADEWARAAGTVDAVGLLDRCMALLAAHLVVEARQAAATAVDLLEAEGHTQVSEAHWLLASAAMLDGDLAAARLAAARARQAFERQRRPRWAAVARHAEVRAAWQAGDRSPELLDAARRCADDMAQAGLLVAGLDARLIAAQLALELDRSRVARGQLDLARGARRGPVDLRARAWHAEALSRLADGNRRGAQAALRAGLRALDSGRRSLGASELRAHLSGHGLELGRLGLRLALEDRNPVRVLAWAERSRARSLTPRPIRPPDDPELAETLAELRLVTAELDQAAVEAGTTSRLLARQAALERAIQLRVRRLAGAEGAGPMEDPSPAALRDRLGQRALIEIVQLDQVLYGVVVAGRRVTLHALGDAVTVAAELTSLRFGLERLAFGHRSARARRAAATAVRDAAAQLDTALLAPLASRIGDRPLVIAPTGLLHAVPWAALPSCAGRPVTVAPSAGLWLRAGATPPPAPAFRTVLAAGPGLPMARQEVAELASRYPAAVCLSGAEATADATARALDHADLAHVAAHGRFRADNPLLSSLRLHDGPLTVYDLETLQRSPTTLVLPACNSGLSEVRPGDELTGLVASLLCLGTRTVVAPVLAVPDAATMPLMLAFHDGLGRGLPPAEALAAAGAGLGPGDDALVVAAGFVCFGAG
jgi:tetratricopeptide (TPR) repeat protein